MSLARDIEFLTGSATEVAPKLLGWRFYTETDDGRTGGIIVETEAYTQEDAASHSFRGKTPRTEAMFGPAGYIYVYFTYGMHHCVNIVTGHAGHGQGVLLRALKPDSGLEIIRQRRGGRPDSELTNGPGKLCQALGIHLRDSGQPLNHSRFLLLPPEKPVRTLPPTERIGITRDTHRLWRFTAELAD
jgi:DNA-3-methyladenine glycosylase